MIKIGTREDYYKVMGEKKKMYLKEDCPFCKIEEQGGHTIWKGKFWYILYNLYSYTGDNRHIMAVPYRHIAITTELNDDELLEMKDIFKEAKKFFQNESYFSFVRETMHHRSVEHLHVQFVAGKLKGSFLRKMLEKQGFPVKQDLEI